MGRVRSLSQKYYFSTSNKSKLNLEPRNLTKKYDKKSHGRTNTLGGLEGSWPTIKNQLKNIQINIYSSLIEKNSKQLTCNKQNFPKGSKNF